MMRSLPIHYPTPILAWSSFSKSQASIGLLPTLYSPVQVQVNSCSKSLLVPPGFSHGFFLALSLCLVKIWLFTCVSLYTSYLHFNLSWHFGTRTESITSFCAQILPLEEVEANSSSLKRFWPEMHNNSVKASKIPD